MTKLNLNDFNLGTENAISKVKKDSKKKAQPKQDKLSHKLQVSLKESEYQALYQEFEKSGFTSFGGFVRMKLKNIKFI